MTHRLVPFLTLVMAFAAAPSSAKTQLTPEDRIEIMRGLTAEYATAKIGIPRSKGLPLTPEGKSGTERDDAARELGPGPYGDPFKSRKWTSTTRSR
jgi:hypothetical protein